MAILTSNKGLEGFFFVVFFVLFFLASRVAPVPKALGTTSRFVGGIWDRFFAMRYAHTPTFTTQSNNCMQVLISQSEKVYRNGSKERAEWLFRMKLQLLEQI